MSRLGCEQAMALLDDYLKRELTPDQVSEVKAHLKRCRDCEGHACFEESFLMMLETCARKQTCPKELRARILAALRAAARDS
jgi:anti-sigma factor (TIGR02949 family)